MTLENIFGIVGRLSDNFLDLAADYWFISWPIMIIAIFLILKFRHRK